MQGIEISIIFSENSTMVTGTIMDKSITKRGSRRGGKAKRYYNRFGRPVVDIILRLIYGRKYNKLSKEGTEEVDSLIKRRSEIMGECGVIDARQMSIATDLRRHQDEAYELDRAIAKEKSKGDKAAIERLLPDLIPIMKSEDFKEGIQSFIERREADFKGY